MPHRRASRPGQPSRSPRRVPYPTTGRRRPAAWARLRGPVGARPPRDWIQISVTALPGVAAIIALVFASLSVRATNSQLQETRQQLQTTEQGQITDRYTAAAGQLGSPDPEVRLGGIYALQRLATDSPHDQTTIMTVLASYIRLRAQGTPPPGPGQSLTHRRRCGLKCHRGPQSQS